MDFSQSWLIVGLFLAVLLSLPAMVKWLKDRSVIRGPNEAEQTRIVSAVAVGPHQRVVTVEVGSAGARTQLVLGVTPQHIQCLHSASVPSQGGEPPPVTHA